MALTLALLTGFILLALGLSVGLLCLFNAVFETPAVIPRRVDTRRRAAEALVRNPQAFLAHSEMSRNVAQSA